MSKQHAKKWVDLKHLVTSRCSITKRPSYHVVSRLSSGTKPSFQWTKMRCFSFQSWNWYNFWKSPRPSNLLHVCLIWVIWRSCSGSDLSHCSLLCIFLTIARELLWQCSPNLRRIFASFGQTPVIHHHMLFDITMFLTITTSAQATWEVGWDTFFNPSHGLSKVSRASATLL